MKIAEWSKGALAYMNRFKYVGLILLAGVILLAWPAGKGGNGNTSATTPASVEENDPFRVAEMEERLAQVLSQVEGAGEVHVVLTLRESPRAVLAQDGRAVEGGGQTSRETSTVLISRGSGVQEPVPVTRLAPTWQGALVVARGAGDPRVRLALSEAVSALTGLGTDKISICKGK